MSAALPVSVDCNGCPCPPPSTTPIPGPGGAGVTVEVEPPGANCPAGGVKITSAAGITYVCNGEKGTASVITVEIEPPGANCEFGGIKITTDAGVEYVCNGGCTTPCTDGTDGINAFTVTTANFTQPAELANVTIEVANSAWVAQGEVIFVSGGGYYGVVTVPDATHITLTNLEDTPNGAYPDNVAPGTVINMGATVSPGGVQGPEGATGATGPAGTNGSGTNYFRADKNGVTQTQAADGVGTDITFGTQRFDDGGVYDPGTSIWTAIADGFYVFEASVGMVTTDGTNYTLGLYKNGGFGVGTLIGVLSTGSNIQPTLRVSTGVVQLSAGDTVQVHNFQAGGSATTISGSTSWTWFSGFKVAGV